MSYKTLRWAGIIFPALMIGLFETIRHEYLERFLPGMIGNVVTAVITMVVTFLFFHRLFRAVERINSELALEQRKTSLLQERDRIAREMHDGISQSLFFLNIKLKAAQSRLKDGDKERAHEDISDARATIETMYDQVRQTIYDLRTAGRADWTLDGAIEMMLEEVQEQTGISAHLQVHIKNEKARRSVEAFHLLRIARESINNALRHGNPTEIKVFLEINEAGNSILEVFDDGRGFDVRRASKDRQYGLAMMQERATLIGGELKVVSAKGKGTTVRATVPLHNQFHREGSA